MDIKDKLFNAVYSTSDSAIRYEIADFNLILRDHLRKFPIHYNTPHRTKGQRGQLRKPRRIVPIMKIDWTDVTI